MTGVFLNPRHPPPTPTPQTQPPPARHKPTPFNPSSDIYATHSPTKLPNTEDMEEEQADVVEKVFDLDYDIAQAFCSHIVPKVALLFMGEAPDNGM